MNKEKFFELLEKQNFSEAAQNFSNLNVSDKEAILKQLANERKSPAVVSVLYRKLHEGKNFDDFYQAWLPPKDAEQPFKTAVRVINAINMEDIREIISIGLIWGSPEELFDFYKALPNDKTNQTRHDNIAKVADKISSKIYIVKSDTELKK